jgi:cation diffusion facilitator family transporter
MTDETERERMIREKQWVALSSIGASAAMTAAKFGAALLTGSLGMLSESVHSLLDLGAAAMTYFAVRVSDRPADDTHHYGHSKIESVSALVETGLLFVAVVWILYEATHRLLAGNAEVESHPLALAVILGSIAIDFFRARALARVAKSTRSEALEADALHFATDMWSSLAVLFGLISVALGWIAGDALAAVVVAIFTAYAGWRLGARTIGALTDTAPEGAAERLHRLVAAVDGVVEVERVRVRPAGATLFVDMEIAVARTRAITDIAAIKDVVAARVHDALPEADLALIAHPRALDDETVHDRVMVIARNRALAVHHLTVQDVVRPGADARLAVSVDLEVDGRMTLAEAHAVASELEEEIVAELGSDVEVETHIEPLLLHGLTGADVPADERAAIAALLASAAAADGVASDVHNVRARRCDEGLYVNFHCRFPAATDVETFHAAIDSIERRIRAERPDIRRAIGHAEPLR